MGIHMKTIKHLLLRNKLLRDNQGATAIEYGLIAALIAVAAIAAKAIKEITYHLRRSSEWLIRLGDGTQLANDKTQHAVNTLWKYSNE